MKRKTITNFNSLLVDNLLNTCIRYLKDRSKCKKSSLEFHMGHKGAFSHHWRKNTHKDSKNWPLNLPKKKVSFPRGKMS